MLSKYDVLQIFIHFSLVHVSWNGMGRNTEKQLLTVKLSDLMVSHFTKTNFSVFVDENEKLKNF